MHDWNTVKNSRRGKCWPASTMKGIKKLSIKTFSPATGDCYETVQKFHKCPKSHAYDIGTKIYERVWILSYYRVPKKNFILWKLAVANITADNEKFTIIFLENARDSFVDHIFIIWLGYIYPTLAKRYLLWLHVEVFGRPLCLTPGLLFEFLLLILPRAKNFLCKSLITLSLGTLASGNWAAKSAGSPGRKFLVPLLLWNYIERKDHWGWLNRSLGGIFILGKRIQHRAWKTTKQFEKNSSHVLAHLLVVREGLGVLLVFPRVSYGFLTANSNICHGIFDKRKFFLRHPVHSTNSFRMKMQICLEYQGVLKCLK